MDSPWVGEGVYHIIHQNTASKYPESRSSRPIIHQNTASRRVGEWVYPIIGQNTASKYPESKSSVIEEGEVVG